MQDIQKIVISHLNLNHYISHKLRYFTLSKKVYITFYDDKINKSDIKSILEIIAQDCKNNDFNNWKSIIVVAETTEKDFNKKELLYFDGINTFANLFLINNNEHKIFSNDSFIFTLGLNYKKYVKELNQILKDHI